MAPLPSVHAPLLWQNPLLRQGSVAFLNLHKTGFVMKFPLVGKNLFIYFSRSFRVSSILCLIPRPACQKLWRPTLLLKDGESSRDVPFFLRQARSVGTGRKCRTVTGPVPRHTSAVGGCHRFNPILRKGRS